TGVPCPPAAIAGRWIGAAAMRPLSLKRNVAARGRAPERARHGATRTVPGGPGRPRPRAPWPGHSSDRALAAQSPRYGPPGAAGGCPDRGPTNGDAGPARRLAGPAVGG